MKRLAVLANYSWYPLFTAWRANSGYRLWLAKRTRKSHGCFSALFWLNSNDFISVLFQLCGQLKCHLNLRDIHAIGPNRFHLLIGCQQICNTDCWYCA